VKLLAGRWIAGGVGSKVMTKLGDVVFCVDCDLLREANASSAEPGGEAAAGETPQTPEHPRRMATKKDANGDPLCAQCLDERQSRRRSEFMLSDERRSVIHWPRRGERTARLRSPAADPMPAPSEAAAAPSPEIQGATPAIRNKAAFVRGLPLTLSAKEVIERARELGVKITPAYIYVIRSNDGSKRPKPDASGPGGALKANGRTATEHSAKLNGRGRGASAATMPVPKGRGSTTALAHGAKPNGHDGKHTDGKRPSRGAERRFMWLATELGFHRTQQLLDEMRSKVKTAAARKRPTAPVASLAARR
jgi:hypothetical protein